MVSTLRLGVVGTGFMGTFHIQTASQVEGVEITALVDSNPHALDGKSFPEGAIHYLSVGDALAAKAADAYIVAVPDRLHEAPVVELLSAGLPVLLEKPMADTLESARRMKAAEEAGGARLMVGQIMRFDPRYAEAHDAVASGRVGDVLHLAAGRISTRNIGTRMNGTSSPMFYVGVHDVDAVQWITGKRITRIYSRAVSKLMPSLGVQDVDAILSVFDLEGGAVGELFNGWTRPNTSPVGIDGRFELFGTEGVIEVDVRDHGIHVFDGQQYTLPDALHWPEVHGRIRGDLAAEVRHFVNAVRNGTPFVISVEEAMRDVAVNDAIFRSLASGLPEDVELV